MSVADASGIKVSELEREVEQSRDEVSQTLTELQSHVTGTIDEWRHRFTAEEISKEVKAYVSDSARKLASNLAGSVETRFRENPASLVAMGAIAAWPAYRIARKIPLPVYLMGAGVVLMKPMGRAWEHGREAFADLTPPRDRDGLGDDIKLAERARGIVDAAAPGLRQSVNRNIERISETAHRVGETVSETVSDAAVAVSSTAQSVGDQARSAYASAADLASSIGSTAQDTYGSATDLASELPRRARRAGARAGRVSRDAAGNPWVIALVGVATTAAIAAALPRGSVRQGGRAAANAAASTVSGARAAIGRAYDIAVEQGIASGLSPDEAAGTAKAFVARMMPEQKVMRPKKKKRRNA